MPETNSHSCRFSYNDQKPGASLTFSANEGLQSLSVDAQTLNDLVPIAQFRSTSAAYPDGVQISLYYNPPAKDVYLCKADASGSPVTENGSVTLYDVFKDDVTLDYSMDYLVSCYYNEFQIQKAQGEMVADSDQSYFVLDKLFTADGIADSELLNGFTAANGADASAETTDSTAQTDASAESQTTAGTESEAVTTEPVTTEPVTTDAPTTAAPETTVTVQQTTISVTEPAPAEHSTGMLTALVIFLAIMLAGAMTACVLLVRKVRELRDNPAPTMPDTTRFDNREKEYQAEIVRLAQENKRLKDELAAAKHDSDER